VAEITMSLEEFLALTQGAGPVEAKSPRSKRKRVGKKDPKMARALKRANAMGRKKNGGYKKGWSQGKIMSKAHQLRRKM
jgi:hypothetical protein